MWTFFQIERRYFNHWILGIWSSLNESALRNCEAEIIIHSNDGREYQVKMKIILTQSTCKTITSEIGFHLLLMQSQLFNTPGLPHEKKLFSYEITIFTNESFREKLNYGKCLRGETFADIVSTFGE